MAGNHPDENSEEYLQALFERQIRRQCELHGWATAVSVANPVDILILCEEQEIDVDQLYILTQKGKSS